MEKDNKKARDDARRDYNDTVRVSKTLPSCCIYVTWHYVVSGQIPA